MLSLQRTDIHETWNQVVLWELKDSQPQQVLGQPLANSDRDASHPCYSTYAASVFDPISHLISLQYTRYLYMYSILAFDREIFCHAGDERLNVALARIRTIYISNCVRLHTYTYKVKPT